MTTSTRLHSGRTLRGLIRASRTLGVAIAALFVASSCKDSTGNTTVASLRFATLPTSVVAGEPFTVVVELLNPSDAVADGSGVEVTLRLAGTATLSGATTVNAVRGIATFEGLSVTTAASTNLLEAQVGTGPNAILQQSTGFTVMPAAPNGQQSTAESTPSPLFPFGFNEMTFTFKDQFGNAIANAAVSISASRAGSTLSPSEGTTNGAGRFETFFDPGGEGSVTFTATIAGTTFNIATELTAVDLCPPAPLTIGQLVNGQVPAGNCMMGSSAAAAYRFTTGATGLQVAANAAFTRMLQILTDPPSSHVLVISEDQTPLEWLLPAGTYRLQVGALAGTGAFTVTTTAVPGNTPGDQIVSALGPFRLLATAGTYTDQALTPGDYVGYFAEDQTASDFYVMFSTRPCRVRMIPNGFHAWLEVVDYQDVQAGFRLTVDGEAPVLELPFGCRAGPTGGPLLIVANHFVEGFAGGYTLEVTFIEPQGAPLANAVTAVPTGMEPLWDQPVRIRPLTSIPRMKRR